MARNRKKRGLIEGPATGAEKPVTKAAKAAKAAAPVPVVEPAPKRGPTAPKVKVKKPRYQRPPRAPAKAKVAVENAAPKPITYAALTLTQSVAKSMPKPGAKLTDQLPGRK